MHQLADCRLILAVVIFWSGLAPVFAQSGQPVSIFDKLTPQANVVAEKTNDMIRARLKNKNDPNTNNLLWTPTEFKTPLIITAEVKTDSTNIRLVYGDRGVVILNWEVNGNELRFQDPRTGAAAGVWRTKARYRKTLGSPCDGLSTMINLASK